MVRYRDSKIGILGGSFDPPHKGHLIISKIAIKKIKLRKIYWVVAKKNPFKTKTFFSLKKRIELAKKIAKKTKKIKVIYIDDLLKSSKAVKAVQYISKKDKSKNLYFIIGSDILLMFHKWHNWKKIVKLTKLIVFSRKGYDRNSRRTIVVKYLKKNKIIFIKNKPIPVSSTLIKKKLKKN